MLLSVRSRPSSSLLDSDRFNRLADAIPGSLRQLTFVTKGLARLLAHHGEDVRVVVVRAGSTGMRLNQGRTQVRDSVSADCAVGTVDKGWQKERL